MSVDKSVSLATLGDGAAVELFNTELQRVLDNVVDENTQATVVREVTLKIKIKPQEDRDYGDVQIQCTSKLAPIAPFPTHFFIGKHKGRGVATEHNPKQMKVFDDERPGTNVVPLAKEGGAE